VGGSDRREGLAPLLGMLVWSSSSLKDAPAALKALSLWTDNEGD